MSAEFTAEFIKAMQRGYLECAAWADAPEGSSADGFSMSFAKQAGMDCAVFFEANRTLLIALYGDNPEYAGHDLWLTRNGHGAGFWDRGYGADGDTLTEAAEKMGEVDLYVNDNNLLDA